MALIRYVSLSGANGAAVLSDLAVPLRETKPVRNLHLRSARLSVAASARNGSRVLNGIFYILWTGCQWKAMPKDFPPESTVHGNWDDTLERIHHELYVAVRDPQGREASPTVVIIDAQTAEGGTKGGLRSILQATTRIRRFKGAKRHILVDMLGLSLNVVFILPTYYSNDTTRVSMAIQ